MSIDERVAFASIGEIGKLFRARKLSPVELTQFLLARLELRNPELQAFLTITGEMALKQARQAEVGLCSGRRGNSRRDLGPLHGIPLSLKDNIYTKGIRTTAGSKILRDFVPAADAPLVTALKRAGAVIVGKTNMHEFAYGTTSNNPHYGAVRNPWDTARIAGGSSGGAAAAVAAGLSYGAIGTDTGGSVRIPAALCGVVGWKPGLGKVSTEGVISLSRTLDVVGPLARNVDDAAHLYDAIATRDAGVRHAKKRRALGDVRLGIPREFYFDLVSEEVRKAFDDSIRLLKKRGAKVKEVSVPLLAETEDAGNQIAWAEATRYHQDMGWYPAQAAEYGEDVRTRLEMGTQVSALAYLRALQVREEFIAKFHAALEDSGVEALVTPTTPIAATKVGEDSVWLNGRDHAVRGLLLRLNRPSNLAGNPALSLPCGSTAAGLPVGMQLIAGVGRELWLLALAREFEQVLPGI